jgi:peptidyl-dipeptidase Dcp
MPNANPLFAPSPLPYQAPLFDQLRDADFQPAIEEGMREHLAEVARVAGQDAEPTFDNTIVGLERAGALLTRAAKLFFALTSAHTNEALQAIETEVAPQLAAHDDAIYLDDRLFARVERVYAGRDAAGLTPEQRTLVERYHRDFVRAGARLAEGDKARLRALNQEEATLTTEFRNRLLAATKGGAVVVERREELEGLSEGEIAAAAEAAEGRGLAGRWLLPLQNTTQQPAQAALANRALRQRLFEASTRRADEGGPHATGAIVRRLAALRAERAGLLGFASYAAYKLDDQMARTPDAALALLTSLAPAAVARAGREAAAMAARQNGGGDALAPWDWQYHAEQVRKAEYDLDESQIKPYLQLQRVLRDGVFFAATRLFGLTFVERHDLPRYHPDVCVFEVFDADGSPLALFYGDFFGRESKRGGAWMDTFVDQSRLLGTRPVVLNVCNFTKPAPGEPALLSFDDVTTLFHEFGHALHGMLSSVEYPALSGTSVPRDFVEFPSQFYEHWSLDREVLASYARHHETGEPMPGALVEKIERARTFDQGFATTEYLGAAFLDLAWHQLPAGSPAPDDVAAFEAAALARHGVAVPLVPPRYRTPYFAHAWGGDYAAGYYAYMWAEVLDHDAFAWFGEHGGLTRANGQRLRDTVLSRGGSGDPGAMYRAFRGRDPRVEPLLAHRGLDHGEP